MSNKCQTIFLNVIVFNRKVNWTTVQRMSHTACSADLSKVVLQSWFLVLQLSVFLHCCFFHHSASVWCLYSGQSCFFLWPQLAEFHLPALWQGFVQRVRASCLFLPVWSFWISPCQFGCFERSVSPFFLVRPGTLRGFPCGIGSLSLLAALGFYFTQV